MQVEYLPNLICGETVNFAQYERNHYMGTHKDSDDDEYMEEIDYPDEPSTSKEYISRVCTGCQSYQYNEYILYKCEHNITHVELLGYEFEHATCCNHKVVHTRLCNDCIDKRYTSIVSNSKQKINEDQRKQARKRLSTVLIDDLANIVLEYHQICSCVDNRARLFTDEQA